MEIKKKKITNNKNAAFWSPLDLFVKILINSIILEERIQVVNSLVLLLYTQKNQYFRNVS